MAQVKFHKFVAALPAELEANAIYYVRAGAGFDIYVTNSSGTVVAYPLNVGGAGQGFFRTEPIAATATGQTVFTVPGGYTPGAVIVSLNGASLPPADYTATNGTNIALASGSGIVAGSVLLVHVLSAFEVANALPIGGTAADSSKLGGTPAEEFYRRGNILGTVSQSGGVPTGAIIERGSNVNGQYVRWADGTQRCRISGAALEFFNPSNIGYTWDFPAQFVSPPQVLPQIDLTNYATKIYGTTKEVYQRTTSQSRTQIGLASSAQWVAADVALVTIGAIAEGRWY